MTLGTTEGCHVEGDVTLKSICFQQVIEETDDVELDDMDVRWHHESCHFVLRQKAQC